MVLCWRREFGARQHIIRLALLAFVWVGDPEPGGTRQRIVVRPDTGPGRAAVASRPQRSLMRTQYQGRPDWA